MACKKIAYKLFLLTVNVLFANGANYIHIHLYDDVVYNYHLPMISYDYLDYSYVETVNNKVHYVPYQKCESAIKALPNYEIFPFTCYVYDNYICSSGNFVNTIPYYIYRSNPIANKTSMLYMLSNQNERISEKQCALIYNSSTGFRLKRNMINIDMKPDQSTRSLTETPIKKVQISKTQVAGGAKAYHNEFPYMCALGWRKNLPKYEISYNCGCVLIDRQYVLTAAHCASVGGEYPLIVHIGDEDLDKGLGEIIKIQNIILHPNYDSKSTYNDIAVVKLKSASRKTPACLWPDRELPRKNLIAIGYGQTTFSGTVSNTLLKVNLNILANENCNLYYAADKNLKHGISPGQICAGDPQGKMDTCQGDSGGPLIMKSFRYKSHVSHIVGLTSFGKPCASSIPGVYTRISYYIDWIEAEVWK